MTRTQLLVLGGGPGGYAAAFLAADAGMDVTLVEQSARLGGTCLLQGCIPSKALLHVTHVAAELAHLHDDGWGIVNAHVDIELEPLRARKEKLVATLAGGLGQLAKRRKVKVITARGEFMNSTTLRLHAEGGASLPDGEITFDHAIVATGSRPIVPPLLAVDSPRVWTSKRALQLDRVPESLLVVGGGYIGLELGTVYAGLGSRVSVVELTGGLLPGADPDLVRPLARRLTKWLYDPATRRLLGCGIVGTGAGELISEAVLALEMGCDVGDLGDTIHPHPTLSETLMNAADVALGSAIEIYKPIRSSGVGPSRPATPRP